MTDRIYRHGEVLLVPVATIPAEAITVAETEEFAVAHSETGHHHVIRAQPGRFVTVAEIPAIPGQDAPANPVFLTVRETAQLVHLKTFDRHQTLSVLPGTYNVRQKEEYDYTAALRRRVMD